MAYDGEAIMGEGGTITLSGLPYEAGRRIKVHTESRRGGEREEGE